jgi:pSer/pThr/pTyr-binding forkhead associated (FHA) protein
MVEDLGSSNGTFINDRQVQSGLLRPGDELRLDTVRFLLVSPEMDLRQQSATQGRGEGRAAAAKGSGRRGMLLIAGLVVLAVLVALAWYASR